MSPALRLRHLVEPAAGILCVLLIWELVGRHAANATLVPPPATVWRAFAGMLDSDLPADIGASLLHLGIGYGLGAAAGLLLALLAASSKWVEAVIDPFAEFLRPSGGIGRRRRAGGVRLGPAARGLRRHQR